MNPGILPAADMTGPGGVRRLAARWEIRFQLQALTPLHLGAGEAGDYVDLALLRDRASALPLLTGASLAGGLRDVLCEELLGDRVSEARGKLPGGHPIPALFGGYREDPLGSQSQLIVFDALGDVAAPEVRDGVRIETRQGTAAEHGKFDMEVWPPGTTFEARLDLQIPGSPEPEPQLLAALLLALEGFVRGKARLGAKGRRGFGRCALRRARARRYALDRREGWLEWLCDSLGGAANQTYPTVIEALRSAWPEGAASLDAELDGFRSSSTRAAREAVLRVPIAFRGGVIIGSPQRGPTGADERHLRSGDVPVLSGTSVTGALRQRALRIARVVRGADAEAWVEELFGSAPPARGPARARDGASLSASRLTVEEVPLDGIPLEVTRIQIDRFTQAPPEGALLQEEPVFQGRSALELRLALPGEKDRADALLGLLLLVVKDLLLGDVPLGGKTGVGRGIVMPAETEALTVELGRLVHAIGPRSLPSREQVETVEGWVRAFHDHPELFQRPAREEREGLG